MGHQKQLEIVRRAQSICSDKIKKDLNFLPLKSIYNQLCYVKELLESEKTDRSKIPDINIGLVAAREIEGLDFQFAELLYEVDDIVRRLRITKP